MLIGGSAFGSTARSHHRMIRRDGRRGQMTTPERADIDDAVATPSITFTHLLEMSTTMTMAMSGLDAEDAVRALIRTAHSSGRHLIEVCAEIIAPFGAYIDESTP
jgi:hypothetical protein